MVVFVCLLLDAYIKNALKQYFASLKVLLLSVSSTLSIKSVGERHANMESLYDYGARSGFWRLHELLTRKKVPW